MNRQLYIDGIDAYAKYGVFVTQGSHDNLVAFPALKEVDKNDWPEDDGQEFDLSSVALDTKEISISLAFTAEWKFSNFVQMLSGMGYHDFLFTELGRTYRLRLASQGSYELHPGLETAKFTFANDFPREGYVYQEPVSNILIPKGYEIDDKDLSNYGVLVLAGSDAEIRKSPAVKKSLLQSFKKQDGAIYDGEVVKFQTKDVNLKCLMRADTIETFWRNRDALLHDLTKLSTKTDSEGYEYSDSERIFYCDEISEGYPCYYKSCSTNDFLINDGIWWQFTLTLVFTSFRLEDTEYLLSSEAGELIITEDGESYIDLRSYADTKEEN